MRVQRLLAIVFSLTATVFPIGGQKQRHHPHMRGRRYELTLFIRNHNVTDATFFRLVGVDNTADFIVKSGDTFEHSFEVRRKGYWTLFVEFPGDRYAKSPRKIISRDSHRKWVMEVYYYPGAVGFSEWHKIGRRTERQLRLKPGGVERLRSLIGCSPLRKLLLLKTSFFVLCVLDIFHWAYMLREEEGEDGEEFRNTWSFYESMGTFDISYLISRIFGEIFTEVLGLGAALWTRKKSLTIPCLLLQLILVLLRGFTWPIRFWMGNWPSDANQENLLFIAFEFVSPGVWALQAALILLALRELEHFEHQHGYVQPPLIVLTVKNDENDESVQIEIT